jgi:hypothetical protein
VPGEFRQRTPEFVGDDRAHHHNAGGREVRAVEATAVGLGVRQEGHARVLAERLAHGLAAVVQFDERDVFFDRDLPHGGGPRRERRRDRVVVALELPADERRHQDRLDAGRAGLGHVLAHEDRELGREVGRALGLAGLVVVAELNQHVVRLRLQQRLPAALLDERPRRPTAPAEVRQCDVVLQQLSET